MHIKQFLTENEKQIRPLLNKNNFKAIYSILNEADNSNFILHCLTSEFTMLMFDLGIDPLKYMDHIPPYYLFEREITKFSIPKHIRVIGREAFSGTSLKQIQIPQDCELRCIEAHAFAGCEDLTEIELSDHVTDIGYGCFDGCSSLEKIFIPETVTKIDNYAFAGCPFDIKIVNEGEENVPEAFPTNKYDDIDLRRLGLDEMRVGWFHGWPRDYYRKNIWS